MRLRELDNEEIASLRPTDTQYPDGLTLYRVRGADDPAQIGIVWLRDLDGSEYPYTDPAVLAEVLADPDAHLASLAEDMATDADDVLLARLAWGLTTPEEVAASEDYDGPCRVLVVGSYYGYAPLKWVSESDLVDLDYDDTPHEFATRAEAEAAIAMLEGDGPYHLAHNEAGRPDYHIVSTGADTMKPYRYKIDTDVPESTIGNEDFLSNEDPALLALSVAKVFYAEREDPDQTLAEMAAEIERLHFSEATGEFRRDRQGRLWYDDDDQWALVGEEDGSLSYPSNVPAEVA
jgi:hypothetical protein